MRKTVPSSLNWTPLGTLIGFRPILDTVYTPIRKTGVIIIKLLIIPSAAQSAGDLPDKTEDFAPDSHLAGNFVGDNSFRSGKNGDA